MPGPGLWSCLLFLPLSGGPSYVPPPDSWLLLHAFQGPLVSSTWYTLFSTWSLGFCYILKWQESISDVSSTKMLSLAPVPFARERWLSSLLLWTRVYTCIIVLILLCYGIAMSSSYPTLVSFIFFHLSFNWRKIALHCCVGFLVFPTLACQGWSEGGSDWKVQHLLCLHYSPQGRCCSEGFTFTIKSSFDSHSDPVKVRPFL